jgi:hypothetical protein
MGIGKSGTKKGRCSKRDRWGKELWELLGFVAFVCIFVVALKGLVSEIAGGWVVYSWY